DLAHDRQTEARAAGLGGEKRIEQPDDVRLGDSAPGVDHFDDDSIDRGPRCDSQLPASRGGIDGIDDQVDEYLLELLPIPQNGWQWIAALPREGDATLRCLLT